MYLVTFHHSVTKYQNQLHLDQLQHINMNGML